MQRSHQHNRTYRNLLRQWLADRELRLPLAHAWRGCLGLAARVQGTADDDLGATVHGHRLLLSSSWLHWIALREIPP